MRPVGSSEELERRRRLAVAKVEGGHSVKEVADILNVTHFSVLRWLSDFEMGGYRTLKFHAPPGRPHKLTYTQEKIVLRWIRGNPLEFGFPTELWTTRKLSQLIEDAFDVHFNPHIVYRLGFDSATSLHNFQLAFLCREILKSLPLG